MFETHPNVYAHAASDFGMRVAWINRYGQRPERLPFEPDLVLKSLTELPARLGAPTAGLAPKRRDA